MYDSNQTISPKAKIGKNVSIGLFTIIEEGVVIEDDVQIGNFCIVSCGVCIGKGTIIKNYVEIRENVVIGTHCYLDSYVSFSGDALIGNEVVLRYGVIIARGVVVGDKSYLAPRVMTNNLDNKLNKIGGAKIGERCFIGTHSVIQHGITIENDVVVGSLSFVNKNCRADRVFVGIPAIEKNNNE